MGLIAGGLFMIMGLLSGLFLVLAPLGVAPFQPGLVSWVLFPGLTVLGVVFMLLASRSSTFPVIARITGGGLLLLGVIAAVGLFLTANSIVQPVGGTHMLWYVLTVGLVLGPAGLSAARFDKSAIDKPQ